MAYIRIAFLALLAAAVATALWYRGQSISAKAESTQLRADLAIAASVNKQNQATIATLKDDLRVSNLLSAELAIQVETIDAERDALSQELDALKESDNDVKSYLGAPVPPALRGLYDRKTGSSG